MAKAPKRIDEAVVLCDKLLREKIVCKEGITIETRVKDGGRSLVINSHDDHYPKIIASVLRGHVYVTVGDGTVQSDCLFSTEVANGGERQFAAFISGMLAWNRV